MPQIAPSLPRFNEFGTSTPAAPTPTYTFPEDLKFSYVAGDFATNAPIVMCDGLSAWKQMCLKHAFTPRNGRLAYDSNFGIDFDLIRSARTREEAQSFIASELIRALMSLEGTLAVDQFTFDWEGDRVFVTFIATPKGGAPSEFHFGWVA